MTKKTLFGVVCASITPMKETGEIDYQSIGPLVQYLQEIGVNGLYPIGTTGESMLLSVEERSEIAKTFVHKNQKKLPLYVQCGDSTQKKTLQNIRNAQEIGADGAGIMMPCFFPCDEKSIEEYLSGILDEVTDFPIYLYNIPKNSANDLSASLYLRLLERYPNIVGIKYSSADMQRVQAYMEGKKQGKTVLTGSEYMFFAALSLGGVGCVSGTCPVFPKQIMPLYEKYVSGDLEGAYEMQRKILEIKKRCTGIPVIALIKAGLKMKGIIESDKCRSPIRQLTKDEYKRVEDVIAFSESIS